MNPNHLNITGPNSNEPPEASNETDATSIDRFDNAMQSLESATEGILETQESLGDIANSLAELAVKVQEFFEEIARVVGKIIETNEFIDSLPLETAQFVKDNLPKPRELADYYDLPEIAHLLAQEYEEGLVQDGQESPMDEEGKKSLIDTNDALEELGVDEKTTEKDVAQVIARESVENPEQVESEGADRLTKINVGREALRNIISGDASIFDNDLSDETKRNLAQTARRVRETVGDSDKVSDEVAAEIGEDLLQEKKSA